MTNESTIQKAAAKAKRVKCFARRTGERRYEIVTPRMHRYTVRFVMTGGVRYGICNCAAGSHNVFCYHLIPAALLDTALTGYVPMNAVLRKAS